MTVTYNAHHVEVTDLLKDYFSKKLARVEQYGHLIGKVEVYFEYTNHNKVFKVETQIEFPKWKNVFFSSHAHDMYRAIDDLIERIESNLAKFKMKIVDHKRNEPIRKNVNLYEIGAQASTKTDTIALEELNKKPMGMIDAVNIMTDKAANEAMLFYNYEHEHGIELTVCIKLNDTDFLFIDKHNINNGSTTGSVFTKDGFNKLKRTGDRQFSLSTMSPNDAKEKLGKEPFIIFKNTETNNYSLMLKGTGSAIKLMNVADIG